MDADVIVVGGGPAGLMAGAAAGMHGAQVLLLDKGQKLGRKLAISGGGRCNVTNNREAAEVIRHIPGNGRFLYSPFSTFDNRDIIRFFEELGVTLKEEDEGRMFPVSDRAQAVVDALLHRLRQLHVEMRTGVKVTDLLFDGSRVAGVRLADGKILRAAGVIVAVGGKSVPQTGSTGDGYDWAVAAGHTVTELFPTEVPLTSAEPWIRNRSLQGVSLRGVQLSVWNPKGKKLVEHTGDLLFTHFGLSGPIALRCSQFVVKTLKRFNTPTVRLILDFFPVETGDDLQRRFYQRWQSAPQKSLKNMLKSILPERVVPLLMEQAALDPAITWANFSKAACHRLVSLLKSFPIEVNGTLPLEKAFVTGGGIHLKEIVPRTMESKKKTGLYFAGEILDIHGYTGGYNITAAFSTGFTAGKNAAEQALGTRA
ncbi:BaiN/RdsA family NAD(P)/FAD-dependent oxidoreductase [Desmospora profundinema]|uniref:Rossmann fold flavoprotein n=1 Tax=Desmospora profundinema TaxID=1571184 RepID=A0ABU1IP10_9BACL|nr:NAD(P)/FAD-dependent oxidoreductase [Desmospora profundinema]MDR6226513.1 putative Rossmann fold flavoprotein [Desmospora profundinema]